LRSCNDIVSFMRVGDGDLGGTQPHARTEALGSAEPSPLRGDEGVIAEGA
jgi:hypothetical protein